MEKKKMIIIGANGSAIRGTTIEEAINALQLIDELRKIK